jgi:hypothetical protein
MFLYIYIYIHIYTHVDMYTPIEAHLNADNEYMSNTFGLILCMPINKALK